MYAPNTPIKSRSLLNFYVTKCSLAMHKRPDMDSFLVEVETKFNLLEFIFIFDVVFGFYCSVQKSRENTEIKSY